MMIDRHDDKIRRQKRREKENKKKDLKNNSRIKLFEKGRKNNRNFQINDDEDDHLSAKER